MIRKSEVFGITEDDKDAMACLEVTIDKSLKSGRNGAYNGIWLGGSIFASYDKVVIEAVLKKYRDAGWKVEHHSDQRDGESYQFS